MDNFHRPLVFTMLMLIGITSSCCGSDTLSDKDTATGALAEFQKAFPAPAPCIAKYEESEDHPADTSQADAMEKSLPVPRSPIEAQQLKDFRSFIARERNGFKDSSLYTFYSSGTNLMLERTTTADWNKGIVIQTYYEGDRIIEVHPSEKQATVKRKDVASYPYFIALFPCLHKAFGFSPDSLLLVSEGRSITYTVKQASFALPFKFTTTIDHVLHNSEETDSMGNSLRSVAFSYAHPNDSWPIRINSKITDNRGHLLDTENWKLLKVEPLPAGFVFAPQIDSFNRATDKTIP